MIHPPKVELFDIEAKTNTDPKGIVRAVREYRVTPHGLYLARATPGRAQFHFLESWVLPELGLRITDFYFNPGHERDQDFYLDVVDCTVGAAQWRTVDLYLDLVLRQRRGVDVLDVDELLAALTAGFLDMGKAQRAIEVALRTVGELAAAEHDLTSWLGAKDIRLSWHRYDDTR